MRKYVLFTVIAIGASCASILKAQDTKPVAPPLSRCGTEESFRWNLDHNPDFKADYERRSSEAATGRSNGTARVSTLTGPVTIPVVVHVVLPNPNIITEEQIDYFLARLNLDYSGLNPDSTPTGHTFTPLRGHSFLRFTRARTDPNGNYTSGLDRRVGAGAIATTTYQAIKHSSAGGLDPWDVTQYYNLWVGDGGASGLLGIAPAIGVGAATETTTSATGIDGVCVDYRGFSNGCFSYAAFALGRTAVHEIGHNFGLFHTFSGCADGADFGQVTPATQTLPSNLFGAAFDDTPGLSAATSGCPGGGAGGNGYVASNCANAPNPPGKMYQNYMDYTDDPCYSMFTNNQVARIHYMLETYRPGYLTTTKMNAPAGFPTLDAGAVAIANPGGSVFNNTTCTLQSFPIPNCPGAIAPSFMVTNYGATTITSITAKCVVGATTNTVTFPVSLLTYRSAVLTFPSVNLVVGANTITFTVLSENGVNDSYATNNVLSTTVTLTAATPLPFSQDFVSATFPPTNMTIFNPNGNVTWTRSANGNVSAGAAFIDNYNNNFPGQIDDIRSLPYSPGVTDSIIIGFDLAHRPYSLTSTTFNDTLKVLVSTDCGATFTPVYSRWNTSVPSLATGPVNTGNYTTPVATDWRRERISLGGTFVTSGPIIVAFRNINKYGNNIFIDNINISPRVSRDLSLSSILSPSPSVCGITITPQMVVKNNGADTITSFKVNYVSNGGAVVTQVISTPLLPTASATFTFPNITVPIGANNFVAYTSDPVSRSGTGDLIKSNDTLTLNFTALPTVTSPIVEGFEGAFPSPNFTVINPDNAITWAKTTPGRNSNSSVFIDNWNYATVGEQDAMKFLPLNTVGADSVLVSFDVAHKNYTGADDYLLVAISTNCGVSYNVYYNKSGTALATAGVYTAGAYLKPASGDWRRDKFSVVASSNSIVPLFVSQTGYGNNLYLDNINIEALYKRDLKMISVQMPALLCNAGSITPSVVVKNVGSQTDTAFNVSYSVDGGAAVTTVVKPVTLKRDSSITVALGSSPLTVGYHSIKFYSWNPQTISGTGDMNPINDTLVRVVSVTAPVAAPLSEGFESASFPPSNWGLINPNLDSTWIRSASAKTGTGSAFIHNYTNKAVGTIDELYTPVVTYASTVDSVFMKFDLSASTQQYAGSTAIPLDTLEVLATTDCGKTFTSVYKKWGNDLQTIGDPNSSQTFDFKPLTGNQWRTEAIDLSTFASKGAVQLVFRNTNNNDNNIFIDNVNITTKTLPQKLKDQGYLVYPNPFAGSFNVQHYLTPTDLRGIGVYNSVGQRVLDMQFNGNASSLIPVDMSRFPADVYLVKLVYDNRTITEKVIKTSLK